MEKFFKITSGSIYDRYKQFNEEQNRFYELIKPVFNEFRINTTKFAFEIYGKDDGEVFNPKKNKINFLIVNNIIDYDKFKSQTTKATHYESNLKFKQDSDVVKRLKDIAIKNEFKYYKRPYYFDLVGMVSCKYRFFFENDILYFSIYTNTPCDLEFKGVDEYKEVSEKEFWNGLILEVN